MIHSISLSLCLSLCLSLSFSPFAPFFLKVLLLSLCEERAATGMVATGSIGGSSSAPSIFSTNDSGTGFCHRLGDQVANSIVVTVGSCQMKRSPAIVIAQEQVGA